MIFRNKKLTNTKLQENITNNNKNYDGYIDRYILNNKVRDSISNPVANLGVGTDNILNYSTYENERITQNYQLLSNLYRDSWVVQNIIQTVPNDITKKWFDIKTSLGPDFIDKVNRLYRKSMIMESVNEGMAWGRLFGGAIGIILIEGQENNLDEPLNFDLIRPGAFRGLYIIDRWNGVSPSISIIDDITDSDFGLPEYYDISDSNIGLYTRVHHSKVIRFVNRRLPMLERIREMYWGESEIEALYRDLLRRDSTAENISSLIFKANLSVMKIKDLDQIFSLNSVEAQKRFWDLLSAVTQVESNLGVKVINSEDDAQYLNYSFGGIKDIYEALMMDLAGASRIPVTKLFGRSPAGMNSTGEADLQNYYDFIDDVREGIFKSVVLKLLPIIALSAWGEIPEDLDYNFRSMKELDDSQKTTIIQQRSGSIIEAFNANLITQDIAQKELKALSDDYGIFDNITDELIDSCKGKFASELQQMNDPMAGLMGGMGGNEEEGEQQNNIPPPPQQQDSDEEVDDVSDILLKLKNDIINNNIDSSLHYQSDNDIDRNVVLTEYKNISKMLKKVEKLYEEQLQKMYSYSSQNDVPEDIRNNYEVLLNKYNNLTSHKNKLENDIKKEFGIITLMKLNGLWDKAIKEVEDETEEIQNELNQIKQNQLLRDKAKAMLGVNNA